MMALFRQKAKTAIVKQNAAGTASHGGKFEDDQPQITTHLLGRPKSGVALITVSKGAGRIFESAGYKEKQTGNLFMRGGLIALEAVGWNGIPLVSRQAVDLLAYFFPISIAGQLCNTDAFFSELLRAQYRDKFGARFIHVVSLANHGLKTDVERIHEFVPFPQINRLLILPFDVFHFGRGVVV